MAVFLSSLPSLLATTSIVLEARDARLPLTSVNPAFDRALEEAWQGKGFEGRERLVVYTKRDLGDARFENPLRAAFAKYTGQKLIFADSSKPRDIRRILDAIVEVAKENAETHPRAELLVVGMPNVGKSTLLNALRNAGVHKGKAFRTSSMAGLTRKFTGRVRIHTSPDVYVSDTPGVMVPFLGRGLEGSERGMKLALTAGIKEELYDPEFLAAYLLHLLPPETPLPFDLPHPYASPPSSPPISPPPFLAALATRLGHLLPSSVPNTHSAAVHLLHWFRKGGAGQLTLDFEEVGGLEGVDEGVRKWVEAGMGEVQEGEGSRNQEKKLKKEEQRKAREKRWKLKLGSRASR